MAARTGGHEQIAVPADHQLPAESVATTVTAEQPTVTPNPTTTTKPVNPLQGFAEFGAQLLGGKVPPASPGDAAVAELQFTPNVEWKYAPAAGPILTLPPQMVSLSTVPPGGYVTAARVLVTPVGRRALVLFDFEAGERVVALVDLDAEVELAVSPVANLREVWDLNPAGDSLVGLTSDKAGSGAVAVWSLSRNKVESTWQLAIQPEAAVRSAHWISDDHLLLVHDDRLECLQLQGPASTLKYRVLGQIGPVAVSSDRRVFAAALPSGIALLDPVAVQQIGWLSLETAPVDVIEFSPDGRQLFASTNAGLMSWDLASGTPRDPIPQWAGLQRIAALTDGYLLADASRLLNTVTAQETWQYQPADDTIYHSIRSATGMACYVSSPEEGQPAQLVILALPETAAVQASGGREQGNRPGASVLGRQGIQTGGEGGHSTPGH